jgi:parallel beta-helix repeat protein
VVAVSLGTILIEDDRITDPGELGIRIGRNTGAVGFEPTVRNNTIEGAGSSGIAVTAGGSPQIVGNTLTDNGTGISWGGAAGSIEDNSLIDNGSGIRSSATPSAEAAAASSSRPDRQRSRATRSPAPAAVASPSEATHLRR